MAENARSEEGRELASGFTIGGLRLESRLVLAPLAGIADSPFRVVCRQQEAALVFSEMVSSDGVERRNRKTLELVSFLPAERPIGIQLFGSDPDTMAAAAERLMPLRPDLIDLNFGCPARKVVGRAAGCALLNNLALLRKIAARVVSAVPVPVTAKIRSGWDERTVNADQVSKMLEDSGVKAVTVHARSRADRFKGKADWEVIARARKAVGIPILGNGDVTEPQDAVRMLGETGCDAVMVGRGALGNPWIFSRTRHLLSTGNLLPPPSVEERLSMLMKHIDLAEERAAARSSGEGRPDLSFLPMRKHVGWYTKGLVGSSKLRQRLGATSSWEDLRQLVNEFGRSVGLESLGHAG